jgi:hypothetical protein
MDLIFSCLCGVDDAVQLNLNTQSHLPRPGQNLSAVARSSLAAVYPQSKVCCRASRSRLQADSSMLGSRNELQCGPCCRYIVLAARWARVGRSYCRWEGTMDGRSRSFRMTRTLYLNKLSGQRLPKCMVRGFHPLPHHLMQRGVAQGYHPTCDYW